MAIQYEYSHIPKELQACNNWLVFKLEYDSTKGKYSKIPYSPRTHKKANKVEHCTSFIDAVTTYKQCGYDGIGFQFSGTPYSGIDLDNHVINGRLTPFAMDTILTCNTYWEYSPSGKGIHIIGRGKLKNVKGFKRVNHDNLFGMVLEVYSEGRFFTFTGRTEGEPLDISDIQNHLDYMEDLYHETTYKGVTIQWGMYEESDSTKLNEIEFKARTHDYSGKFTMLYDHGDISAYNDDHSRADSALMCILAFWTRCDPIEMLQLFERSVLAKREKWQQREDYRRRTVEKAIHFIKGHKVTTLDEFTEEELIKMFNSEDIYSEE